MISDQVSCFDDKQIAALLDVMKRYRRKVEIDWVNRTIRVLSPEYTDGSRYASDGKLIRKRDVLCRL